MQFYVDKAREVGDRRTRGRTHAIERPIPREIPLAALVPVTDLLGAMSPKYDSFVFTFRGTRCRVRSVRVLAGISHLPAFLSLRMLNRSFTARVSLTFSFRNRGIESLFALGAYPRLKRYYGPNGTLILRRKVAELVD